MFTGTNDIVSAVKSIMERVTDHETRAAVLKQCLTCPIPLASVCLEAVAQHLAAVTLGVYTPRMIMVLILTDECADAWLSLTDISGNMEQYLRGFQCVPGLCASD